MTESGKAMKINYWKLPQTKVQNFTSEVELCFNKQKVKEATKNGKIIIS